MCARRNAASIAWAVSFSDGDAENPRESSLLSHWSPKTIKEIPQTSAFKHVRWLKDQNKSGKKNIKSSLGRSALQRLQINFAWKNLSRICPHPPIFKGFSMVATARDPNVFVVSREQPCDNYQLIPLIILLVIYHISHCITHHYIGKTCISPFSYISHEF